MSDIKLKSCPCCDNEQIDYWEETDGFYYCERCGLCGPRANTRSDAREKWNALPRRSDKDSPIPPEPEFKFGDKVAISYNGKDWSKAVYIRKVDGDMPHEVLMQVPWHYGGQEYHVKFCRHEEW